MIVRFETSSGDPVRVRAEDVIMVKRYRPPPVPNPHIPERSVITFRQGAWVFVVGDVDEVCAKIGWET